MPLWGKFVKPIMFLSLNLKHMTVIGTFTLTLSSGVPVNLSQRAHGLTLLTLGRFKPHSPTHTGIGVLNGLAA